MAKRHSQMKEPFLGYITVSMMSATILGIESSCDETAVALWRGDRLLASRVATQSIHEEYGGVVPELASRGHQMLIVPVLEEALQEVKLSLQDIDALAVTQGPGLLGSLMVGVSFANGLGLACGIPLVGAHHTRAHLLANWLEPPYPTFPLLGLIVSGGHTQLALVESPLSMRLLGSTCDDAVGEAFDKIAKMMGMPYPGGGVIDRYSKEGNPEAFQFSKTRVGGLDFSFSGIKTSFRYFLEKKQREDENFVQKHQADLCASIQKVLVDTLVDKVVKAMEETGLQRIAIGGGVANNSLLRSELAAIAVQKGWEVFAPSPKYCSDNAAMIAIAGHFSFLAGKVASSLAPMPRMIF